MVKIRLMRMGMKKKPFYRVVVADERVAQHGNFIEQIGTYDPNKEPSEIKIDADLAKKWIGNGAKPTETVGKLLKRAGVTE
ncbi:MAG: 30S ribosomal protein S16 [Catonella sp.]|jgi:small subunit ribosomal protein S16|nr:30S ribosomal protein S16 [Catonella sp.]MDY6355969.1 30S ribosomal protein S16 [Catonella sp.]